MLNNILNIVNIILVFQLGLFIAAIILSEHNSLSRKSLILFTSTNALLVSFSITNSFDLVDFSKWPIIVLFITSIHLILGPSLFLYIKSLKSERIFKVSDFFIHFSLPLLMFLFLVIDFYFRKGQSDLDAESFLIYTKFTYYTFSLIYGFQLFIYILRSFSIIKSYENKIINVYSNTDKVSLRWLNILLYVYSVHWLSENIFPLLYYLEISDEALYTFTAILSMLSLLIFTSSIAVKSMINSNKGIIVDDRPKYSNSLITKEKSWEFLNKILDYMENSKPYLNPDLKIGDVAEKTGISEKIISQLINQHLNKHFFDFVNSYRINEAKKLLAKTQLHIINKSILEIIFDSGFNSKSAFNRAFKKHSGKTPSQFKSSLNHEYSMVPD